MTLHGKMYIKIENRIESVIIILVCTIIQQIANKYLVFFEQVFSLSI